MESTHVYTGLICVCVPQTRVENEELGGLHANSHKQSGYNDFQVPTGIGSQGSPSGHFRQNLKEYRLGQEDPWKHLA